MSGASDRSGVDGPRLVAVCVGQPELRGAADAADTANRAWRSAIWKRPVVGPVRVHRTGLLGDAQADTRVHGGPEKALLGYAIAHYAAWGSLLDAASLGPGAFGENLALDGFDEATVAIGDVFAIGAVRLQVSQPRGPCWKLARKFQRPDFVERVIDCGWTGWYFRVLQEGHVEAGGTVAVDDRPHPDLTIRAANRVLYERPFDRDTAAALVTCPALAPGMRQRIAQMLEQR